MKKSKIQNPKKAIKGKFLKILFYMFLLVTVVSCKKDINVQNEKNTKGNAATTVVTFNKDEIPNTPEEFQHAVQLLLANQNYKANHREAGNNAANVVAPLPDVPPPTANYNYVRFKPADENQMYTLTEGGCNFELYEEPLHLEDFEYTGDDYEDPAIPADQYPWFYTCVPVGYPMPTGIQYEIIQPLFLYNDDPNEPADIEDSWGGEVEDKPDSTGAPNLRTAGIQSVSEWMQQNGNPMEKATQWIKQSYPTVNLKQIKNITIAAKYACPVDPCSPDFQLYVDNPAYACAGLTCNTGGGGGVACSAFQESFRPKGNLYVRNTSSNTNDPFKQVKVRCRRAFKLGKAYTDANGHFECNKTYPPNKKVRVIVKFKNPDTKVRSASANGKFWQFWFPVKHKFDKMKNCALETISYTFANDGSNSSKATRKWSAATYLTAHYDMKNYCFNEGLIPPNRTKVWMTTGKKNLDAFTPMFNYTMSYATGGTSLLNIVNLSIDMVVFSIPFVGPVLTAIIKIIEISRPDIIIPISNNGTVYNSRKLYNTIFHELSHASHYKGMGYRSGWSNASNYWVANGIYTWSPDNSCGAGGYGCKTGSGAQRSGLIEGWGFYGGNIFNSRYFGQISGNVSAQNIRDNELLQIENQIPVDNIDHTISQIDFRTSTTGWIPYGMLLDLQDNAENTSTTGVTDNVNTYTMKQVYEALDVNLSTVQGYKQNLLNKNGNKQAVEVNTLVTSYRY